MDSDRVVDARYLLCYTCYVTSFYLEDNHDRFWIQTIFRNPKEVKPYTVPMPERCNLPAAAIHVTSDTVVIVDANAPAAHVVQHKWQPNTPDGQGTPFLFQHGKAGVSTAGGTLMRMFKGPVGSGSDDWSFPQVLAFPASGIRSSAIVSITSDNEIITGMYSFVSIFVTNSYDINSIFVIMLHELFIFHEVPMSIGYDMDIIMGVRHFKLVKI